MSRKDSIHELLAAEYGEAKRSSDRKDILAHLADVELGDTLLLDDSSEYASTATGTQAGFTHQKRRNRISSGTRVWLNTGKQKHKATIVGVDPTTSQVSLKVGHDTVVRKMRDIEPMLKVKVLNWDEPGCPVLPEPSYTADPIRYIASNIFVDVTSKKNCFYKLADSTGWIPQSGDGGAECLPVQTDFYEILNGGLSAADALERQESMLSLKPQLTSSSLKNQAVPTSAEDIESEEAAKEVLLEKEAGLRFRTRNLVGKDVWATFYWQTRLRAVQQYESTGDVNIATLHEMNARSPAVDEPVQESRELLRELTALDLYVEDLDSPASPASPVSRVSVGRSPPGASVRSASYQSPESSRARTPVFSNYKPSTVPAPSNEVLLACVQGKDMDFNSLSEEKKIEMARIKAQSRMNLAKGLNCFPLVEKKKKQLRTVSLPSEKATHTDTPLFSEPSLPRSPSPTIPVSVIRDISSSRARGRMQVIEECLDRPASPSRAVKRPMGVRSNGQLQPAASDIFEVRRGMGHSPKGTRRPQKQLYTSPKKNHAAMPVPPLDPVVRDWLVQHGMAAYIEQFARNKVDAQRLPHLTKDDLIYMELPRSVQFTVSMLLPNPCPPSPQSPPGKPTAQVQVT